MDICWLGPMNHACFDAINAAGDHVLARTEGPITGVPVHIDALVSYGYRHRVPADVLRDVPIGAINLHPSLLPWNRGAHPLLWSVLEETPCGVTIHAMDAMIDTGVILAHAPVTLGEEDTFRTGYAKCHRALTALFAATWPKLRETFSGEAQVGMGTQHSVRDYDRVAHLLPLGWDTPIKDLRGICGHEEPVGDVFA